MKPCESKTASNPPTPIGWYSVDRRRDLIPGQVKSVHAFDRELVLYRTRTGVAVVTDAFCPHLGAHLGDGRVVGESIRCPFHGWRYDTGGRCVEIPYCDEIPERARIRTWPVCEVNTDIMVWYHPEQAAPAWEVPLVEELGNDEWTEPRLWEFTVPIDIQNVAENVADAEHFHHIHRQPVTPPSTVTIDEDGRTLRLVAETKADQENVPEDMILQAIVHNPGLSTVRTVYGPGAEMLVYSTAQPVSPTETLLRWSLTVTRSIVDFAGDDVMDNIQAGISDDMVIWRRKIHRDRPLFCKADKDLILFRKWVRQFYL